MKNFLANLLSRNDNSGILSEPGDEFNARVTPSRRKVIKLHTGTEKYSATQYPNGTTVETKVTKKRK